LGWVCFAIGVERNKNNITDKQVPYFLAILSSPVRIYIDHYINNLKNVNYINSQEARDLLLKRQTLLNEITVNLANRGWAYSDGFTPKSSEKEKTIFLNELFELRAEINSSNTAANFNS
jgi:hypothetical protein